MLHSFWSALQFLTRIPVPPHELPSDEDLGRSVLFYPLVGLVIGMILVLLRGTFMDSDHGLQAALILLVWVGLTGALHLDGLADSADAWLADNGDRERALDIMKDSRTGAAALVVVTLVLILKFAALSALAQSYPMWPALLVIPALSRAGAVALLMTTPYVRKEGIGARHAEHLPKKAAAITVAAVAVISVLLLGFGGLWVLLVTALVWALWRAWMQQSVGGTTGDTAGAMIELLEVAALVMAALIAR